MKITLNLNYLKKYINISEKALWSKASLESLKGIKIEAYNNEILLTTINSSLMLQVKLVQDEKSSKRSFNIYDEGKVVLNGFVFSNLIKKLNEEEITIEVDITKGNTAILTTKRTKYELITINDYPVINFGEDIDDITMAKSDLISIYNKTKHSTMKDESKPIYGGINIHFAEKIRVLSTDSRRISQIILKNEKDSVDKSITIPIKIYSEIEKILSLVDEEYMKLSIFENQLKISGGFVKIKARLLEGSYPNLSSRFDRAESYSFEVDSENLFEVLARIEAINNGSFVEINVEAGSLVLKSNSPEIGKIKETCEIEKVKGNPFKILFFTKFLSEALHSIEQKNVKISFNTEVELFQVEGTASDNNKQLIAPIGPINA